MWSNFRKFEYSSPVKLGEIVANAVIKCTTFKVKEFNCWFPSAPLMASFPHFYLGDPSLLEPFEGLAPKKEEHEFYLDIQPTLGIPMGGRSRFQMNAMVRKSNGLRQLNDFPSNLILPIAWIEIAVEEIPEHVKSAIRLITETSQIIQRMVMLSLFEVSMAIMLVLMAMVSIRIRRSCRNKTLEKVITADEKSVSQAFIEARG